ncbi:3321_t:CDS:2 [Funneliformis geosporum]|uniref:3321_t:CDS:1 n=1 Tax=Funneliformis geosporum TaxID=1117311 RepID=A0A9W4WT99_9GLOM|nr:3321_t:CDS:2 [Funneliformis geosporum]
MVAVEGLSSDISDEEQKDHKEFKYKEKKISFLKELKVITRSQKGKLQQKLYYSMSEFLECVKKNMVTFANSTLDI